jgi:hypothetical protein
MALIPDRFRKLAINVALLFAGSTATAAIALISTTPKDDLKAFAIAVITGALIAGARAVIGFLALQLPQVPAIPVDE